MRSSLVSMNIVKRHALVQGTGSTYMAECGASWNAEVSREYLYIVMHLPGANELPPTEGTGRLPGDDTQWRGEGQRQCNLCFFTTLPSLPPTSRIVFPHLSFAASIKVNRLSNRGP